MQGRELAANPFAAVVLYFPKLQRQVRVEGRVKRLTEDESDAYWHSRPLASRIATWASRQSRPLSSMCTSVAA